MLETRAQLAASSNCTSLVRDECATTHLWHSSSIRLLNGLFSFTPKNSRIFILDCRVGSGFVNYRFFFSLKHWDTNRFFQVLELAAHFTPRWSKFPYGFCHAKASNFRGFHVGGAAWSTGVLPGGAGQTRVSPSFPVPSYSWHYFLLL